WANVVAQFPSDSTLLIAGDGPLRPELEARIAELGLDRSVKLLGRISDDDLVELYRAADIGIVPTLEQEGFGLVVLEAAACGAASIVTDVGGLPEAVAGLDPSLIVPPGDVERLRDRLERAQNDRPTRLAARAYAERFDWQDVAERHRAIVRR